MVHLTGQRHHVIRQRRVPRETVFNDWVEVALLKPKGQSPPYVSECDRHPTIQR